ncbi:TonB-dependent receptor [Sphingopyxis sp. KK2]|uniref:TonB-dependent receptor n=1 Tax=Sphingopyxis sp. KK2 TaxID=1855727 RepID=UPI001C4E16D5|nr:TonB-dependent receptor [Sphingopyxis sp. KK2]
MITHQRTMQRRRAMLHAASCLVGLAALLPAMDVQAQEAAPASKEVENQGDIIVTASRREETVTSLPFNISAYGNEQLERANVTDVASLTRQVPNFNIIDSGARTSASQIPIIRGLNASQPTTAAARYFQSPVGFYLGNASITGSLPLYDIGRVEVLRGPQGTLYGAGSLAGAVRIVPNEPRLGETSGSVTASIGTTAHSSDPSYLFAGTVNLPIGDRLALRLNARHEYEGGFINARDVLKRQGDSYLTGAPVLADQADVANSPGVYFDKKDYNFARTTSARASLLWEPTDDLSVNLAYNFAKSRGNGGNIDNNAFAGGPSPLDPRRTLEATGDYERSVPTLEPWERRTQLATLDMSYDLGFATVSSTIAYGKTEGEIVNDSTVALLGSPYGVYYTGTPANPRAVLPVLNSDNERSWTQELRIVSSEGGPIDYTAGVFLQQHKRRIGLFVYAPGASDQSFAASGSRVPRVLGGGYVPTLADGETYGQVANQKFNEISFYGDLTWHVTDAWSVTGGARIFRQKFSSTLAGASQLFIFDFAAANANKVTDQIFKLNTSYKWYEDGQIYATFSQGFRRGGTNAFALSGLGLEPEPLLVYKPDRTNNFEIGAKGKFSRIYYSLSAFYIKWDDPQIDLQTPFNLYPAVVNGTEATSKGFEAELQGPIGPQGLSFSLGLAYARARLTGDFSYPAGNAAGGIVPDAIHGSSGDRLPGAPDWSGAGSLTYEHNFADSALTFNLGFDFRSSTINQLRSLSINAPARKAPAYIMFNGSIGYDVDDWKIELFGTNLTNKRVVYGANVRTLSSYALVGDWGEAFSVSRPRELGIRLTRKW